MKDNTMEWVISDGTVVQLGGIIIGNGATATRLRQDRELLEAGRSVTVSVGGEPGGSEELDVNSPLHVNAWVHNAARWSDARVTRKPDIDFVPIPYSPDRVY